MFQFYFITFFCLVGYFFVTDNPVITTFAMPQLEVQILRFKQTPDENFIEKVQI